MFSAALEHSTRSNCANPPPTRFRISLVSTYSAIIPYFIPLAGRFQYLFYFGFNKYGEVFAVLKTSLLVMLSVFGIGSLPWNQVLRGIQYSYQNESTIFTLMASILFTFLESTFNPIANYNHLPMRIHRAVCSVLCPSAALCANLLFVIFLPPQVSPDNMSASLHMLYVLKLNSFEG